MANDPAGFPVVFTTPPAAFQPADIVLAELMEIDSRVDGAEHDGIFARWEFGRALLKERETHGGKQLPHGRLDEVCAATGKSRPEHQFRMQFAAKYPTHEEVSTAVDTFRSWTAIRETLTDKPHVAKNTGENEWYTPPEYIEAARAFMGGIDLDPATSEFANSIVGAPHIFTKEDNGLVHPWHGRVWMNPPYAPELIKLFADKLCHHVDAGDVTAACVLVNNATETQWLQAMANRAHSICFPLTRVRFLDPSGKPGAPLQGQAVIGIGGDPDRFLSAFDGFGLICGVRRHE